MREIKFRGLTPDGIWVYGFLYQDETGAYIKDGAKNKRFGTGVDVERESIGQYTGLKDKNGKEIYEGDVVSAIDFEKCNYQIKFDDGCFYFNNQFRAHQLDYPIIQNFRLEVIGNIYENPELLK